MPSYFSEKKLASVVRVGDSRRFKVDLKSNRSAVFDQVLKEVNIEPATFEEPFRTIINKRPCLSLKSYSNNLVLRVIAKYLGRKFRAHPRTRDSLVKEIIETLSDATPIYIIRRDIKSFYESLSVDEVRNSLSYSAEIPARARSYLDVYFRFLCTPRRGLPRGIGVSAVIAEIAMQRTDQRIKEIPGVYKYFRYSDDILIFSYRKAEDVVPKLKEIINEVGLRFNKKKSDDISLDLPHKATDVIKNFEYLGYKFSVPAGCGAKSPRMVTVGISDRKINKIKSRLICSFKYFTRHGNYALLEDRVRFLASNYYARRAGATSVKTSIYVRSGIYYNYRFCGRYKGSDKSPHLCSELKALDAFYHFLIRGKTSKFREHLEQPSFAAVSHRLKDISFLKGYEHRMTVRFSPERIREIKEAWRNG